MIQTVFLVLISVTFLQVCCSAFVYIDCDGRGFHCTNSSSFLICVKMDNGSTQTVDDYVQHCPDGTYCSNSAPYECMYIPVAQQGYATETHSDGIISSNNEVKINNEYVPNTLIHTTNQNATAGNNNTLINDSYINISESLLNTATNNDSQNVFGQNVYPNTENNFYGSKEYTNYGEMPTTNTVTYNTLDFSQAAYNNNQNTKAYEPVNSSGIQKYTQNFVNSDDQSYHSNQPRFVNYGDSLSTNSQTGAGMTQNELGFSSNNMMNSIITGDKGAENNINHYDSHLTYDLINKPITNLVQYENINPSFQSVYPNTENISSVASGQSSNNTTEFINKAENDEKNDKENLEPVTYYYYNATAQTFTPHNFTTVSSNLTEKSTDLENYGSLNNANAEKENVDYSQSTFTSGTFYPFQNYQKDNNYTVRYLKLEDVNGTNDTEVDKLLMTNTNSIIPANFHPVSNSVSNSNTAPIEMIPLDTNDFYQNVKDVNEISVEFKGTLEDVNYERLNSENQNTIVTAIPNTYGNQMNLDSMNYIPTAQNSLDTNQILYTQPNPPVTNTYDFGRNAPYIAPIYIGTTDSYGDHESIENKFLNQQSSDTILKQNEEINGDNALPPTDVILMPSDGEVIDNYTPSSNIMSLLPRKNEGLTTPLYEITVTSTAEPEVTIDYTFPDAMGSVDKIIPIESYTVGNIESFILSEKTQPLNSQLNDFVTSSPYNLLNFAQSLQNAYATKIDVNTNDSTTEIQSNDGFYSSTVLDSVGIDDKGFLGYNNVPTPSPDQINQRFASYQYGFGNTGVDSSTQGIQNPASYADQRFVSGTQYQQRLENTNQNQIYSGSVIDPNTRFISGDQRYLTSGTSLQDNRAGIPNPTSYVPHNQGLVGSGSQIPQNMIHQNPQTTTFTINGVQTPQSTHSGVVTKPIHTNTLDNQFSSNYIPPYQSYTNKESTLQTEEVSKQLDTNYAGYQKPINAAQLTNGVTTQGYVNNGSQPQQNQLVETGIKPNNGSVVGYPGLVECHVYESTPDVKTCLSYYVCRNNQMVRLFCPFNMVYSPVLRICTTDKSHCQSTNQEFVCTSPGLYPDPKSCYSYYDCQLTVNGFKVNKFTCPWYSSFSPEYKQCIENIRTQYCSPNYRTVFYSNNQNGNNLQQTEVTQQQGNQQTVVGTQQNVVGETVQPSQTYEYARNTWYPARTFWF